MLEREHMQAMTTLEATFEKRLQLQQSEMRAQIAARDDQQLHIEETMRRVNDACAGAAQGFSSVHGGLQHLCSICVSTLPVVTSRVLLDFFLTSSRTHLFCFHCAFHRAACRRTSCHCV